MTSEVIESDRLGDFPHPRQTYRLVGHEKAEAAFVAAWRSGRLPHAWLITGPYGIGKATFAYRAARALLHHGGEAPKRGAPLVVDPAASAARRIERQSHSNLLVLKRPYDRTRKKPKTVLTVDEVRRIAPFFGMAAGEDGWRICIVDTADDMNAAAANAFLKTLEEPPEKSLLLVLANAPGTVLPTIRSRCRKLALSPLEDESIKTLLAAHLPELGPADLEKLAELSQGSVGYALTLARSGGLEARDNILNVLETLPDLDDRALIALGNSMVRRGMEQVYNFAMEFLADHVKRHIRDAARETAAQRETGGLDRYITPDSFDRWVGVWENLLRLRKTADALNLDRKQTLMQAFFHIRDACSKERP